MHSILTRLRGPALRAFVAWTVAFGLVFQMLVPVLAAETKAQDPFAVTAAICATHAEAAADAASGGDPSLPGDKDLNSCCSVCALLHAAKLVVPTTALPSVVLWPTASRRLDRASDETPVAAAAPVPYSSRAPPLAS
ncbi:MAG: DUF2946 family protein [Xanthobacteraceae bacterium]